MSAAIRTAAAARRRRNELTEPSIDPSALAVLQATPALLQALVAAVPERALLEPVDEGWSARDVIAHLLDAEGVAFVQRITHILDEDRPAIRPIDPPARLQAAGYARRSPASLAEELARKRGQHLDWLGTLTPERLQRVGDHQEAGEVSAGNIVHSWACHDLLHLQQIAKIIQLQLMDRLGNMRRFLE